MKHESGSKHLINFHNIVISIQVAFIEENRQFSQHRRQTNPLTAKATFDLIDDILFWMNA